MRCYRESLEEHIWEFRERFEKLMRTSQELDVNTLRTHKKKTKNPLPHPSHHQKPKRKHLPQASHWLHENFISNTTVNFYFKNWPK